MTIDVNFFSGGHLVLRVNMYASSFEWYNNLCDKISNEELDQVVTENEESGDMIFTDKLFIKKMWSACLKHGYISQDYDSLGFQLDKMVLRF